VRVRDISAYVNACARVHIDITCVGIMFRRSRVSVYEAVPVPILARVFTRPVRTNNNYYLAAAFINNSASST